MLRQTEACAGKALQLDPNSCYGHFLLGLVENKRGNEKQAVRLLKRALEIEPDNPDVLYWLECAVSRGFVNYPFLSRYDPFMQNLRGDERFKKLMERVKYEWEHFEV